ncbi:MAG: protein translocase subunit SecF [Bacteroidota bacterium]
MQFFRKTNIDFLSVRRYAYGFSLAVILAGMISLVVQGFEFGIDFRGGTELVLSFDQPPDIGRIRTALGDVGLSQSVIKTFGSEGDILISTTEQAEGMVVGDRIKEAVGREYPDAAIEVLKEDKIGPKIGKELRQSALYALIASLFAILGYIAIRFNFIFGVGAVAALFHDVLVALGALSLFGGLFPFLNFEISQEIVAGFLTLIGVSVNDTVVIFDRIRENMKIYRSMSLTDVINKSLNDTLSRTIITQGTLLLVLIALLVFGGEVTRGFAFTLTIGTIAGTYSSIYVASAIVVDWRLRKKTQNPKP